MDLFGGGLGGLGSGKRESYSLPGVVFYLNQEWKRFERERNAWAVQKAQLEAKVTLLQGEKASLETANTDMLRRIKMLEQALRQERAKSVNATGSPVDNAQTIGLTNLPAHLEKFIGGNGETGNTKMTLGKTVATRSARSRQILQRYLDEISASDDLLGPQSKLGAATLLELLNSTSSSSKDSASSTDNLSKETGSASSSSLAGPAAALSSASSASNSLSSVGSAAATRNDEETITAAKSFENISMPALGTAIKDATPPSSSAVSKKQSLEGSSKSQEQGSGSGSNEGAPEDAEGEELIQQLSNDYNLPASKLAKMMKKTQTTSRKGSTKGSMKKDDSLSADKEKLSGLDELANVRVEEAEPQDQTKQMAEVEKNMPKQWKSKCTMKSHYDSVRCVAFQKDEVVLASASEDGTVKLWNVAAIQNLKKAASADIDPFYTYRGHEGPVFALAVASGGRQHFVFSGGFDGNIMKWNIPPTDINSLNSFDAQYVGVPIKGHQDVIWSLDAHPDRPLLASASADSNVKLWSYEDKTTCVRTIASPNELCNPSCLQFAPTNPRHLIVSYTNGGCYVFDIETGQEIVDLYNEDVSDTILNIACHPTQSLVVTAHEDKKIQCFDFNSGRCVQSMVAHLDAVSALSINPGGNQLISGGHDSSIRVWDLNTYGCVQEFTSHRKKYNEAVHSLKYHSKLNLVASGGADSTVRIYTQEVSTL